MFPKRLTKRERLAAIMAEIDVDSIRELPEECEEITTSEIGVAKPVTITEDGRVLHGSDWVKPEHYIDDDVASGRLEVNSKPCQLARFCRLERGCIHRPAGGRGEAPRGLGLGPCEALPEVAGHDAAGVAYARRRPGGRPDHPFLAKWPSDFLTP